MTKADAAKAAAGNVRTDGRVRDGPVRTKQTRPSERQVEPKIREGRIRETPAQYRGGVLLGVAGSDLRLEGFHDSSKSTCTIVDPFHSHAMYPSKKRARYEARLEGSRYDDGCRMCHESSLRNHFTQAWGTHHCRRQITTRRRCAT
jgi:hypothetical protein